MKPSPLPAWDGRDLCELLRLQPLGEGRFRNVQAESNLHGRIYGGQVLAQAVLAAAATAPADRPPASLQFTFVQGALPQEPLELQVSTLQEGKRFSIRQVVGTQAGRTVLSAQVSFALPLPAPAHQVAPRHPATDPDTLPAIAELPPDWIRAVRDAFGYTLSEKPVLAFRLQDPPPRLALDPADPRLRFWVRVRSPLPPGDAAWQAAAFAYASDWWLNYAAVGSHQAQAFEAQGLYVASLNHCIWFHQVPQADAWMHFDISSPAAADGRGLSIARVHDRAGRLVASATQECLMTS